MTTIFEPVSSMYNTNYDVMKNIQNIGDLNNKLFCTFTNLENLDVLLEEIQSKEDLRKSVPKNGAIFSTKNGKEKSCTQT